MNWRTILLWVLVFVILYLVYYYVFRDDTSANLSTGNNAKNAVKIDPKKLPGNPASVDFTFSVWIYINSWQYRYGNVKTIYRRVDPSTKQVSPELSLAASTNDLIISVTTFPDSGSSSVGTVDTWNVHNIPIQRWCNISVVTNNRAVDCYIDGKLVNTHVLSGVPKMNKDAPVFLTPDGGFSGETSKFRYIARTISPREAYAIYRQGPGANWLSDLLNRYKLKFSFLKDNTELNSFEI